MPLKIELMDGEVYAPVVVCDHCGEQIENAAQGNYQWRVNREGNLMGAVFFTHEKCRDDFEKAHSGVWWYARELSSLPLHLSNNLRPDRHRPPENTRLMNIQQVSR